MGGKAIIEADKVFKSAPAMQRTIVMGSHETYFKELDTDRQNGCIGQSTSLQ